MSALLADEAVGSAVAAVIPGPPHAVAERARAVTSGDRDPSKPFVVSIFGDESPLPREFGDMVRERGACFIRSPDRALRALARMTAYGQTLATTAERANAVALEPIDGHGALPEYRGKELLSRLGLAIPEGGLAKTLPDALRIARRIGFPVVLKAQAPELPHKTEAGAVLLNIADEGALEDAWTRLKANVERARPGLALDGVLVEKMAPPGLEMVIGARRDPAWGPVLLVGLGGIWVETLRDVRLLAPDMTERLIVEEIGKLRGASMLHGGRGRPRADVAAVVRAVAVLGAMMRSRPEITEVDINPLVVYEEGQGALALDALIVVSRQK